MCDTFLSYAREDIELAEKIYSILTKSGLVVWFDQLLAVGERWRQVVGMKLGDSKSVLVLWTPNSIRSDEVFSEAEFGYTNGLLIPVRSQDSLLIPFPFRQLHTMTWSGNDPSQEQCLVHTVLQKVRREKASS